MCARAVRTLTGSLTSRALARAELLLGTRALHGRLLSTSLSSLSGLSRLFVRCDAVMLKRAAPTLLVHTRHTDNIDYYRQDVKKNKQKKNRCVSRCNSRLLLCFDCLLLLAQTSYRLLSSPLISAWFVFVLSALSFSRCFVSCRVGFRMLQRKMESSRAAPARTRYQHWALTCQLQFISMIVWKRADLQLLMLLRADWIQPPWSAVACVGINVHGSICI